MKTLLLFFITLSCYSQLHLTVGHTDISKTPEGNGVTFSVGATFVKRDLGFKINHRMVYTQAQRYKNIDLAFVKRFSDKNYRMDLSAGASYENQKHQVNPIIGIRNSIKLWSDVWLVVDVENTFKIGSESHTYFMGGFSWDFM